MTAWCVTIAQNKKIGLWPAKMSAPGRASFSRIRAIRGEELTKMDKRFIGTSVPRKEGREKVTGAARYVDDISFPGMIYGATVRSAVPRGRIRGILFEGAVPWNEFTVVTARDIPGKNCVTLLIDDQPCLASELINHPEEPIVLIAHEDKYLLEEARRAVRIEIEPLPAVFTMDDSLARKQLIWGGDNVFKSFHVEKGNVDSAWHSEDFI